MDLNALRKLYAETLLDDVIPFWERHAIAADGPINSCIRDDGTVASRDRWCWSQWRAVWVFSKLYNAIERRPRWLDIARGICDFLRRSGPVEDGHWPLVLNPDGTIQRGYESVFTDGFALYGLLQLWHATHERALLDLAVQTYEAVEQALRKPELPPLFPYSSAPAPDAWAHGISMIFSLFDYELAQTTGHPAMRASALLHHRRVMGDFLRPQRGLVLEWIRPDGGEYDGPGGTVVVPGHAIESMWFQMHVARGERDLAAQDRAVDVIRRHLEAGWDREYGGLLLAVDADGRAEAAWPFADYKLWWPHTEALYATLLAYEHSRASWCLDWHERIREYSYHVYPVPGHGEWYQRLNRRGQPVEGFVALPVKDPFHLPRALIMCLEVLDRLLRE